MISLVKYIYGRTRAEIPQIEREVPATENASQPKTVTKTMTEKPSINVADKRKTLEMSAAEMLPVKAIQELRGDCPDVFLRNHRNVLGIVVQIEDNTMTVAADFKNFILDLAEINCEFSYETGDRVYVRCYVENEELFSGDFVETLEPFAVEPAVKKKRQKLTVKESRSDLVTLSNECFISEKVLKQLGDITFNVGDVIFGDIIECEWEKYKWRCIYVSPNKNMEDLVRPSRNGRSKSSKTEAAAAAAATTTAETTKRLTLPAPSGRWQSYQNRLCEYANQVWSQESIEIIPGVKKHSQRRFKALRLPNYEVPINIRTTYLTLSEKSTMRDSSIELCYASLKQDLTFENYIGRFEALLWLEEVELFKNFRQYDIERVEFNVESDCLSVTIMNLGERRPSLVIGDKVHAYPIKTECKDNKQKPICFEGIVHGIMNDKVLLKFHQIFTDSYAGESYRVEFYFSRSNFRRLHYGLYRAVQNLGEDFLFPKKINFNDRPQLDIRMDLKEGIMRNAESDIKWHNPQLNLLQRSAVFNILRCETINMPYVIYGPPGTGKTITLVECILQIVSNLPQSRLLVATPSNSAANLICTRLIESKGLHMGELVRLVSFNLIERDQLPENLLPYCATADLGEDGTYEEEMFVTQDGIQMNCPKRLLANYRITVGTCSTLGKYLELGFNTDHFTHVLVDEAGQCTEPTIMVAVSQVAKNRGQVILAGDPLQLQAIVVNKYADQHGLSTSFLERIMNMRPYRKDEFKFEQLSGYNPILLTKLCQNYRALPSILRIYNYLFYDLELRSTISTTESPEAELLNKLNKKVLFPSDKRPPAHGAFFYAVRGENMREKDSPSWCNPREANVVFSTTLALYRTGVKPDDIGIITPYMKQVKIIRSLFIQAKLMNPKIGSVEEFQGQERNIILLSTVRTSKREVLNYDWRFGLGFVKSERRLNVAISRARALLIVFGDHKLLNSDDCWCIYVGDCVHNDSFFGLDENKLQENIDHDDKSKSKSKSESKKENENEHENDNDNDNDNDDDENENEHDEEELKFKECYATK